MQQVTVQELKQKIEAHEPMKIVDVRGVDEIVTGMIPGAVNVPTSEIMNHMDAFKSSVPVYVVCQSGTRSKLVTMVMEKQGYPVVNVSGGMNAWVAMQSAVGAQ